MYGSVSFLKPENLQSINENKNVSAFVLIQGLKLTGRMILFTFALWLNLLSSHFITAAPPKGTNGLLSMSREHTSSRLLKILHTRLLFIDSMRAVDRGLRYLMGQMTGSFYWVAETSSIDGRRGKRFVFAIAVIKTDIESAIVGADRMKKKSWNNFPTLSLTLFQKMTIGQRLYWTARQRNQSSETK